MEMVRVHPPEKREWEGSSNASAEWVRDITSVAAAVIGLVVLSPLLLVVALFVKMDSPGPVLFRQERIGQSRRRGGARRTRARSERREHDLGGRPFTFYKFRSMFVDARARFPHLYDYSHDEGHLSSLPIKVLMAHKLDPTSDPSGPRGREDDLLGNDPRMTRVGRWLRRTSLDELPNLLNASKGDMHLVGPRPDIAENICHYKPHELRILDVKPGITGLAQVEGRGLLSFREINELDLKYLHARSLTLDARILLRTLRELVKARGAY